MSAVHKLKMVIRVQVNSLCTAVQRKVGEWVSVLLHLDKTDKMSKTESITLSTCSSAF